jgi:hypothetical protein
MKKKLKKHLVHKAKLGLLLISKILFVLFSFFVVMAAMSIISPWTNPFQPTLSNIIVWGIGLAVILLLYLFMIIRILKILKFR